MARIKTYTMAGSSSFGKLAVDDIEKYLKNKPETISIANVEDDPAYRLKDIDLLWTVGSSSKKRVITIEIKGDRYHKTGNYFFETVSNVAKNTPGCFLYTEAQYIYYYFVFVKKLHILPMPETREWFLQNINLFPERQVTTSVSESDSYNTLGRLVPITEVLDNVNVSVISLA